MKNVEMDPANNAASLTPAQLNDTGDLRSSLPSKLLSSVFSWDERIQQKTPVGAVRSFFDAPTGTLENFELHATTLNVGRESHPAHQHPDEELVIVKEGTLEVTINGNVQRAGAGSVIFYAPNDLHGMRNGGDVPVTYHVIRWISSATQKAAEQR